MAAEGYYSTKDLCDRFRVSSRTLERWRLREENPFPAPTYNQRGAKNLWAKETVWGWEALAFGTPAPEAAIAAA